MRCLSKPWNAFLSQSSFIKSHLDRSIHENEETLLVFRHGFRFNKKPFTAHHTESPHIQLTNLIKLPVVNALSECACEIIGSVNGLICFLHKSYPTHFIYIWNPSLSAILPLPPCTILSGGFTAFFRFGFDPKTNDYKVVKLTSLLKLSNAFNLILSGIFYNVQDWMEVEVYSMRKGCWETINQPFPSNVKGVFDKSEVCVNGKDGYVHWLGLRDGQTLQQTIVAFDLGVKTFFEIYLPDSTQDRGVLRRNALGVLDGKLYVMSGFIGGGEWDLWVMNEYGVAESWVKLYVFPKECAIQNLFGLTSNNELLYLSDIGHLALYDPAIAKHLLQTSLFITNWKTSINEEVYVWVKRSTRGET